MKVRTRLGIGRITVIVVIVVVLSLAGALYFIQSQQRAISLSSFEIERLLIVDLPGNSTLSGFVYVAATAAQQVQGFQGVTSFGNCNGIASNASECIGMMFVFPSDQEICLWMHNTILPLQQVWISGNGTVSAIYQAQPETDFTVCHSATYVLETNPNLQIRIGTEMMQSKV